MSIARLVFYTIAVFLALIHLYCSKCIVLLQAKVDCQKVVQPLIYSLAVALPALCLACNFDVSVQKMLALLASIAGLEAHGHDMAFMHS